MEQTCSRCQQTVKNDDCFCPYCGLPQLVYSADGSAAQGQPEPWAGAPRDASQVDWKPVLRSVLTFAIPAGLFCAIPAGVGFLGLLLMAAVAAWVVSHYMRSRRPAWITIGAGARIGLVTGILAGAVCFSVSSAVLFTERYAFHQGSVIDGNWKAFVDTDMELSQKIVSALGPSDQAQALAIQAQQKLWMLSPQGHAGMIVGDLALTALLLIFFGASGGALCARMLGRTRSPQS
jgi:hypothetical protein